MSVKGMMQTVLVTELKQIQPDISNEALQYVVDNFSQVFDVREILAEENQELFQSNKNLTTALQKVSDYNLRLENDRDSILAELQKANGIIIDLQHNPPKMAKEFLAEIKAEAVLKFAGTVLVKYRYDITEWAKEYADKMRQGGE